MPYKDKEKKKANNKKYRKDNPEKEKERHKKYYKENRDVIIEKAKEYNKKHKKERKKYDKKYRKEHKEQRKINEQKRQMRKKGNGGSYTIEEITKLRKDSKGICKGYKRNSHYVGEDKLTIDHIIPISKGGNSYISNIQLLCGSCNSSKMDKDIK